MQSVSSSYQLEDAKVAISGNLKYQSAMNSGLDFSKILKDISFSQSDRTSKESSNHVQKRVLQNRDVKGKRSDSNAADIRDSFNSKANTPEIKSKREEIRLDSNSHKEKVISTRDYPDKYMEQKTAKAETRADTYVSTEAEFSEKTEKTVAQSESVMSSDTVLLSEEKYINSENGNSSAEMVSLIAAKSVGPESESVSEKLSDAEMLPEAKIQNLNVFSKVSELAQENGIDLTTVDPKVLNELVYKMSANPLKDFDSKAFEEAAVQFLKGDVQSLKTFLANESSPDIQPFSAADVMSMLKELDGTVKVNAEKPLFSMTEDFGAKDFEVIEDSIKTSISLDEILAKEDIKTKIESILDNKKESLQNNFEKSVALLQKVVSGSSVESELKSEMSSARVDSFAANPRMHSESGVGISTDTLFSKSFSEQGNSSSMFSHSGQHGLGSLASMTKNTSEFNLSAMEQSKLDLLNMSSDLKENAKALAMKVMEMSSRNLKSLDLTLNPEGLGKMRIVIDAQSAEEITKISISASHSGTRAMLESGIDVLKNLLESNSIFAKTEVAEYDEESAFNGSSSEEFSQNSGQNQKQHKENEENQSDNGTIFAGGKIDAEASENHHIENNENLNNSQNSNTVSYFA
ncbi:flagellar hook-length control protein FliK [uncultured Succinivibrio sp.]|uniref:flagellar hook-length control protein FliK n=1 Tax=uncultured Succinivibrio sp. TaxID=540749 RepID=UPI0025E04DFF|nr:flagellar hook-length control protein FliK [uncultured Succinivibrio sp.]